MPLKVDWGALTGVDDDYHGLMANNVVVCPSCGTRNRVPAVASGIPKCANCKQPLPWVVVADDLNFDEVADSSKMSVLVDLWAPWCGPCRQVGPVLEAAANEHVGKVKLVKVNVDNSPQLAQRFDARSIPTMLMMRNGQTVARQVGAPSAAALKAWVSNNLG